MTMDRTLKTHGRLKGTRSVLTRAERIASMTEDGKFDPESDSPMGLAKTKSRTSKAGSKSKKAAAEEPVEGAVEGAAEGTAEVKATTEEKAE